ncbi:MAG: hypothetical protein ACI4HI_08960 [Lachnospiraceae bacterium]
MQQEHTNPSFDSMIQNRSVEMLKSIIPYLWGPRQKNLSILVKYMELADTIAFFNQHPPTMEVCSAEEKEDSMMEIIAQLRKFCTEKEQETLDQILNFFEMYNMCDTLFRG